jgi:hypothetical protein
MKQNLNEEISRIKSMIKMVNEQVQTTVTQTGENPGIKTTTNPPMSKAVSPPKEQNPFSQDKLDEYLGETVNLYADPENKKFIKQIRIDKIEQTTEKRYVENRLGNLLISFNFWNDPNTGENNSYKGSTDSFTLEYSCDNSNNLKWGVWFEKNFDRFLLGWGVKMVGLKPQSRIYSNNLTTKLKQNFCTVSSGGSSVPKATFASNKSNPSNLA